MKSSKTLKNIETNHTEIQVLMNIEQKIDKLIGIIAIQGKEQDEQILILTGLGFSSTEIAPLVGTTPGNVRKRIFRKKSKK